MRARILPLILIVFWSAAVAQTRPDAPPEASDITRLSREIRDLVADTRMQEDMLLTYVYFGPFGYSEPEARMTVSREANARIEYLELDAHSRFIAKEMLEAGEPDASKALQKHASYSIKTDAQHCPAAK